MRLRQAVPTVGFSSRRCAYGRLRQRERQRQRVGNACDSRAYGTRIADGYSVDRPKPAPDIFLYAATQLGLAPAHCVVVEDAPVGVAAAIAAGMGSIGIGSPSRVGAANIVLPNLSGVHLTELQTKLDQTLKV
ncbi:MAG: HAD-IA family hydrolase [Chamaesiphon sp.]|nr:HAD-IA family hydrolase [Chamaesiphon sp.]